MSEITVPTGEQGVTRLFALSLTASEARALRDNIDVQEMSLGVEALNPAGVEVFALSDLGDMGLAGYLREGIEAREDDIVRDRTKLGALDGWVMLVHSSAFGGAAATLDLAAALTLIGTYGQIPAPTVQIDLQADAAQPYSGVVDIDRSQTATDRRRGSAGVLAGIVALAALIVWWAIR